MRKSLKILHSLAAAGLVGGLGCYLAILFLLQAPTTGTMGLRLGLQTVGDYLLVPSLAVALVSGLLSMAIHKPFQDKGWVWLKAAMGLLMFKGVLTLVAASRDQAALSAKAQSAMPPSAVSGGPAGHEWGLVWVLLAISIANVIVAIWRPLLRRRRPSSHAPERARAET